MDEQTILRLQILGTLSDIIGYLAQGSEQEQDIAGLVFVAKDYLKEYWTEKGVSNNVTG